MNDAPAWKDVPIERPEGMTFEEAHELALEALRMRYRYSYVARLGQNERGSWTPESHDTQHADDQP